jgi:hypothetical protein
MTWWLKDEIVEWVEVFIARQQHDKHVCMATDGDTATEDVLLSAWSLVGSSIRQQQSCDVELQASSGSLWLAVRSPHSYYPLPGNY